MRFRTFPFRAGLIVLAAAAFVSAAGADEALIKARDSQSLPELDALIAKNKSSAEADTKSAEAQAKLALTYSYASEVALELRDKKKSEAYAMSGMEAARKAVAGNESNAEYHRLLGSLCGQIIPANPFMGALKYGSCARDEISKAISLNGNLAMAYLSRGVGNYYLPAQMGGGPDVALKDIDKAVSLDPQNSDAYLWKGIVLRKAKRNADARQALQQSLKLDPNRVWAKEQLDKTPAQ